MRKYELPKEYRYIEDNHYESQMMQKLLGVKVGNINPSKDELLEMIEFFTIEEKYEWCAELKIKLDELMDN